VSEPTILILAEQPWQLELAAKFSNYLRAKIPELKVELALTDYFTFLHDPQTIARLKTQFDLNIHDLEEVYRSWQSGDEPNEAEVEALIIKWEKTRILSRPIDVIARTNQLIFGWEREFYYLPMSLAWRQKILLDSIVWSENLIDSIKPKIIISIERNTLCNNLVFEISKNRSIEHVTFILSRFGNRWIPHSEFGLGFSHPLSEDTSLTKRVFPSSFYKSLEASNVGENFVKPSIYKASAKNLQNIMSLGFGKRISYVFGKDLGNGVSNLPRLLMQIYSRLRNPRKSYAFPIKRLEQNLVKLTLWELKQIIFYSIRLLGFKLWGMVDPLDEKFFFWGLHSRPEDSTSVLGFGLDEVDLISSAAAELPKDVKILVKEHPIMFGTRSVDFYRRLRATPGVLLVDAFTDTQSFIESSFCLGVVGVSGTMLLEGEIQGKPAFAFGSPEFAPFLSSFQLSFSEYLEEILSHPNQSRHQKLQAYSDFVEKYSVDIDVPYLHDLDEPKVRVMLNRWSEIILGGGQVAY
jgi:hypothetical protein